MEDPNSKRGAGASRVTSTATFASSADATPGLPRATKIERRYRWCKYSNSVQPLLIRKGSINDV